MGALISLPTTLLNLLLPFTNKNTPLLQDLVHTAILCGTLYFAPQIAEYFQSRDQPSHNHEIEIPNTGGDTEGIGDQEEDIPIDRDWVLQDDGEGALEVEPPPLAPTPPPGLNQVADPAEAWEARAQNQPFVEDDLPPQMQPGPGPANERPRPTPANRTIGAKKAKSLARKDQRRAYHEFHRQEAELRRQREAEGKEEREAALAAEKARRAEAEKVIQEKERAERERKKEEERRELEEERQKRERAISEVRRALENNGAVNLVELAWEEDKDSVWIERLVRASGLLSQFSKHGSYAMITETGWAIRVDAQIMSEVYAAAVSYGNGNQGKLNFEEFGGILEKAVKARTVA
jgi:hypothetical protein